MRNILLISILVGWCNFLLGQTPISIKTPTNVTVDALTFLEFNPVELAIIEVQAADWISTHGSGAIRVAPASRKYNCHNYAWHMKDGGSANWINAFTSVSSDPVNLKKY